MAITKTTTVQRVDVYPLVDSSAADTSNDKHPQVMLVYHDTLDDDSDADLPVTATRVKHLTKFVSDGGSATDYSSEDALVKSICDKIWA